MGSEPHSLGLSIVVRAWDAEVWLARRALVALQAVEGIPSEPESWTGLSPTPGR